jgi:hypothetical protein
MRTRLLAIALAATFLALLVAVLGTHSAASAGSGDPRIAVLQKQVKTLQAQVKGMQAQLNGTGNDVDKVEKEVIHVDGQVQLAFMGTTCLAAETADLLQGTWGVIDQIKPTFGPQTQVNDYGNCGQLKNVSRGGILVPPNTNTLAPLINWLHE